MGDGTQSGSGVLWPWDTLFLDGFLATGDALSGWGGLGPDGTLSSCGVLVKEGTLRLDGFLRRCDALKGHGGLA